MNGGSEEPSSKRVKMEFLEIDDSPVERPQESNFALMSDFPGTCGFSYSFRKDAQSPVVSSWMYSQCLNQVFLKMGNMLHIQFLLDEKKAPSEDLYIRATPYYCNADFIHMPVYRCVLHTLEDDPQNESHKDGTCRCKDYDNVGHIIRSSSPNAIYCYDDKSQRHSVRVPIKNKVYDLLFSFACKSSCNNGPAGMGKRSLRIVFFLEVGDGVVLGRCSVNVKICSCPKRDKDRGEREFNLRSQLGKHKPVTNGKAHTVISPTAKKPTATTSTVEQSNDPEDKTLTLRLELSRAKAHVRKLNMLCTSLEKIFDSLGSDI